MKDLHEFGVLEAAVAIRAGDITAETLAAALLQRAQAFGSLNAFVRLDAVGARIVPASIGTDTGGSVRIPAAFCGVMGFRPTLLRWPQAGIVPISSTRDTAGPLARKAADLAAIDAVVAGEGGALAAKPLVGLRIGVPRTFFWDDLEQETARICEAGLDALEHAGAVLIEVDLPNIAALDQAVSFTVALYEVKRDLDRYLEDDGLSKRF